MKFMLSATLKKLLGAREKSINAGLSIHSDAVRLIVLKRNDSGYDCIKSQTFPLNNEDQLSGLIAKIINKNNLSSAYTSIVLPAIRVQSTQIEFDDLPEVDIQAALPWQVKDLISIPPQDMICDYIDMPLQPFGQTAKAQVVATSRQYLEKICAPFHEAKAEIGHVLTEQFAVAKLQLTKNAAQLAFIQHPNSEGVLLILKNQQICFARKIRGTDAVLSMPLEQLRMGGTDNVSIEIQRSIDYYESQLKQPPIKNVFVGLETEHADFIIDALNQSLPVKTKPFPVDDIINQSELELGYIPALGAALATIGQGQDSEVTE